MKVLDEHLLYLYFFTESNDKILKLFGYFLLYLNTYFSILLSFCCKIFTSGTRITRPWPARAATPTPTRPRPPPPGDPRPPPCPEPPPSWRPHSASSSWSWWQCLWGNKWRISSDPAAPSSPDWFQESEESATLEQKVSHWAEKAVITKMNS